MSKLVSKRSPILIVVSLAIICVMAAFLLLSPSGTVKVHAARDNGNNRPNEYERTNLVSDIDGVADFTDPNLVNPWGLSSGSNTAWFVSDNGTGVATSYRGNGKA